MPLFDNADTVCSSATGLLRLAGCYSGTTTATSKPATATPRDRSERCLRSRPHTKTESRITTRTVFHYRGIDIIGITTVLTERVKVATCRSSAARRTWDRIGG